MSAVFRTPLGAALLAAEVLYRDDFESEALVPRCSRASSPTRSSSRSSASRRSSARRPATRSFPGTCRSTRCSRSSDRASRRVPRRSSHVQKLSAGCPVPPGSGRRAAASRSACCRRLLLVIVGTRLVARAGLGILGGGYGAAQVAITGADWLPTAGVASRSSRSSAGARSSRRHDASARAAAPATSRPFARARRPLRRRVRSRRLRLILDDPSIDPGAFALGRNGDLLWRRGSCPGELCW